MPNLDKLPDVARGADELENKIEKLIATTEKNLPGAILGTYLLYEFGQRQSLYKVYPEKIFYYDLMGRPISNREKEKLARIYFKKSTECHPDQTDFEILYASWKEHQWPIECNHFLYDLYAKEGEREARIAATYQLQPAFTPMDYSLQHAYDLIEKASAKKFANLTPVDPALSSPPSLANRWFSHFHRSTPKKPAEPAPKLPLTGLIRPKSG